MAAVPTSIAAGVHFIFGDRDHAQNRLERQRLRSGRSATISMELVLPHSPMFPRDSSFCLSCSRCLSRRSRCFISRRRLAAAYRAEHHLVGSLPAPIRIRPATTASQAFRFRPAGRERDHRLARAAMERA